MSECVIGYVRDMYVRMCEEGCNSHLPCTHAP